MKNRFSFMTKKADATTLKLTLVYLLGFIALLTGWWIGFLGPIIVSAGWVSKVIGGLALCHMGLAFYILKKKSHYYRGKRSGTGLLQWLDKIDTSILACGFLGKLYSIALILAAVKGTDTASIAAGLKAVSNGVSVALFSTMLGLGLSLWTHCATIVVSNRLSSLRE